MYTFTEYLCAKKKEKPLEQCNNKIEKKKKHVIAQIQKSNL